MVHRDTITRRLPTRALYLAALLVGLSLAGPGSPLVSADESGQARVSPAVQPAGNQSTIAAGAPRSGASPVAYSIWFWPVVVAWMITAGLSILMARDLLRRKKIQANLRESEEKWRALMENSPDHIMLMDLDGNILFANRGFLGVEKEAIIGKPLVSLILPEFEPPVTACLKGVGEHETHDTCCVKTAGIRDRQSVFELRMGPVFVRGRTVAIAVNSTDVTARENQERILVESEAFHRTFFEESPTGLSMQDFSAIEPPIRRLKASGVRDLRAHLTAHPAEVDRLARMVKVVRVNQATADLYHAPSAGHMTGPLQRLFTNKDQAHFIDQVVAFTGGADHYEGAARNHDFLGNVLHLILRKAVIHRAENGLSNVLVALVDVTPIKQAEKEREILIRQLQQAQKMEAVGTLAGGVAHDFNNILSIILGNAELSMADIGADNPARLNLKEIRSASLRAKEIVQQLLGFSRKGEQIRKPIHLIPVVQEAVKFLRATIPANIDIQLDLSVDSDVIRADATQIHQVMINLFTNASHAMEPNGGRLSIRLTNVALKNQLPGPTYTIPRGRYVRVTITDTGTGIPSEIEGRIFEPYFTNKKLGKGTGMGLFMVHSIMQSSSGGIILKTTPGQGTSFDLYFPYEDLPAPVGTSPERRIPTGTQRILFVDDDEKIIKISDQILRRLGYRVTTCMDPTQALALVEADSTAFDLLITDMDMPAMTGIQLVTRIRRLRPRLPVILCTGYSQHLSDDDVAELAIGAILDKPVELERLATTVQDVLVKPQAKTPA